MRFHFLIFSLFFISFTSFSQSPLSLEKDFWSGVAIHQNGKKISINDAKKIVNNPEIIAKLSTAQTNKVVGAVISYPCAFAFGYTLGLSMGNNKSIKPNWAVGGIGAVGMIVGILLEAKGNKQLKESVETYNASISKSTSYFKPEFSFSSSGNNIGIAMRF
jgi:hypothetical protein